MKILVGLLENFQKVTGVSSLITLPLLCLIVLLLYMSLITAEALTAFDIALLIIFASPLWMPPVLIAVLFRLWMNYIQVKNIIETEYELLEIRLPTEITQSPLAMETVLNVMYHTGSDLKGTYWDGDLPRQFSLEIASLEGAVRFYIRTRKNLREILEAQIYSQYPTVEIVPVEDYAARIQYDERTMKLFGVEFKLNKPDPYPIKTYVDWGLDKDPKDEYRVDPINSVLEFMGSLGKGEFCFLQILLTAHQRKKNGVLAWQAEAAEEVDKILKRDPKTKGSAEKTPEGFTVLPTLSDEERKAADAILRNTSKKPFDVGVRVLYMAHNDNYNRNRNSGLPTMFRTFESHGLNGFKPTFPTMFNSWNLSDPFGKRAAQAKRELFQAYRWRSFMFPPYKKRPLIVLSTEELATIYHFPSRATATPTLQRELSRKGEAPSNLPR